VKITETQPRDRAFTLEANSREMSLIQRALYLDITNDDENADLHGVFVSFMEDHSIDRLWK
jgi:hypothetical protein